MGTLNFTVGSYAGDGNKNILSSRFRTSGAHTTSGAASFAEDAAGDVAARTGEVVTLTADVAMWVRFGDAVAAAGVGHYLPATMPMFFEIAPGDNGRISAIDA